MKSGEAVSQERAHALVDHFFRHEAGRLTAVLTRMLGPKNLDIAEELVQETLLRALQIWSFHPPPANPSAWLMQVAKRLAIDWLRRRQTRQLAQQRLTEPAHGQLAATIDQSVSQGLGDQLELMFACCQPSLAAATQVMLTLNLLGGLSPKEIATAFYSSEAAVRKRLYRAKKQFKDQGLSLNVGSEGEHRARLGSVLHVVYLMFNEGYASVHGAPFIRSDLCFEAIRLVHMLLQQRAFQLPHVWALAALLNLQAARLNSRIGNDGQAIPLPEQDRSKWDHRLLRQGFDHLNRAKSGWSITAYHLEAAIAAQHCSSHDPSSTDWKTILRLYNQLFDIKPSPAVLLNRAVALYFAEGFEAACEQLETLEMLPEFAGSYLVAGVLGELWLRQGKGDKALLYFQKVLSLSLPEALKKHYRAKLHLCSDASREDPS